METGSEVWTGDPLQWQRWYPQIDPPLIPITDVWFQALGDIADADIPIDVTACTDYVTEQWVEGDKQQWNHFETVGPRTTNNL